MKAEERALHVILFGDAGEMREFSMDAQNDAVGLLRFLQQGFGGGTDFEPPLKRAFAIIATEFSDVKADVLLISDGDCPLSPEFTQTVHIQKIRLDCEIYTALCAGTRADAG